MKNKFFIISLLCILGFLITCFDSIGQDLRKVKAKQKIIAYDIEGQVIDSLTKDLKKQAEPSRMLDQIQVELRLIELELQQAGDDSKKTVESQKRKEELLAQRLEAIQQIQEGKTNLVKEYYIIIESFKKKKNAKNALISWHNKGYKVFLFYNKHRGWYYICAGMYRSYSKAIKAQFELQKDGISSWIYYWAE